jgi:molecular chaperone GrpE
MSEHPPGGMAARDAPAEAGQPAGAPPPPAQSPAGAEAAPTGASAAEEDLRRELAEAQEQRLRALADADNARKRCAVLLGRAEAETTAQVTLRWLPVVDNLERALEHSAADPAAIIAGVRAVRDQAQAVLAGLGFPRRDDTGAPFDPGRHEAVATRPDPAVPDGTVVEVARPAYGEGDHQLRPAQVVVARPD